MAVLSNDLIQAVLARLRTWIAVEDPKDRIEGSGEAITSPQHRRAPEATSELERLEELADDHSDETE